MRQYIYRAAHASHGVNCLKKSAFYNLVNTRIHNQSFWRLKGKGRDVTGFDAARKPVNGGDGEKAAPFLKQDQ